jgi:hypothetical protein
MQRADTLAVIGHDDTVRQFTDVRYTHTRAGLHILTAEDEQLYVSGFDFLHVQAERRHDDERAMAPDPGEPPADDRDVLAAYECPAGGLCECHHQHEPSGQGRWPRCPRCGCACSLPDPDEALGDPDACPCCHYSGPDTQGGSR